MVHTNPEKFNISRFGTKLYRLQIEQKMVPDVNKVNILYIDIAGPQNMDPEDNVRFVVRCYELTLNTFT